MKRLNIVPLALGLLGLVASARAAEAKPKIAVLGIEVIDAGGGLDEKTAQRATWLTDALRRRASVASGPYDLAPNSDKDLLEMKLLSNCSDEALACMAGIAGELGADRLLYGKLERRKTGYQVSLKLLDAETRRMERTTSELIPFEEATKSGVAGWAERLYGRLAGEPTEGGLAIETNAERGTVFVDGEVRTSLQGGSAQVTGLAEGIHTVSIEADGFAPYAERITIVPGQQETIAIDLDRAHDGEPERPGGGYRIAFWSTLVASGASGGAWAITGLSVLEAEEDKANAVERIKAIEGVDGSDSGPYGPGANVCESAENEMSAMASGVAGEIVDICDRGQRSSVLTWVFGTATTMSALAAGYFYYKGYVQPGGGSGAERKKELGSSGRDSWSLRVEPRLGPDLVGAGLSVEF